MNLNGIIVGTAVFLIIGICHPIVIKMEYNWGKKCWWVLLSVGLGLPIVYVGMFLSQVNLQADKWKLGKGRPVYTVTLHSRDFTVVSDQKAGEAVTVDWKDAAQAFRMPGCIYLYASPAKVFLLPDGQADAPDQEVWAMIMTHLGADKCRISPALRMKQKLS